MFYDLKQEFPDQTMSNEVEYRSLLQHIIFFFFGNSTPSLKESSKQVHDTLNFLILNWQLKPTFTEKRQFAFFITIQFLRVKNKQTILSSVDDLLSKPFNQNFERTKSYLKKALALSEEQAYHEALFFNAYILIYDATPLGGQPSLKRKNEVDKLTEQQLKIIEANLIEAHCCIKFPKFTKKLNKINTQTLSPFFFINTYIDQKTVNYFLESYPVSSSLAVRFVETREKTGPPYLSLQSRLQLFYQYLVLILNELPATFLQDQIHIVVDFSVGRTYNRFIQTQLLKLTAANVVIDPKINKQTDLFISDKFNPGVKVKQLTWNCPPTPQDWQLLRSLIVGFHLERNKFI